MSSDRKRTREKAQKPVWMREEPGARRAGLSREEIGKAAVTIADADGFDDVSMRRIARELGAGTMSLYHYVQNKDELLSVMFDVVMGELIVPEDELTGTWRESLLKISRATRKTFKAHPWVLDAMKQPAGSGPNGLRHFEQSMAAVNTLDGVPQRDRLELVGLIDDYVFGFILRELLQEIYEAAGDPDMTESAIAFFESELATDEYPNIRKLIGRGDIRTSMERLTETFSGERANDRRFERGLNAVLDGFEVNLKKRKKPSKKAKRR